MSDEKALLATIWEHPHDDTPRLVYADWLQENDQPERAEFIRVQCEIARLDEWDDQLPALEKQAKKVWKKFEKVWRTGLPSDLRDSPFQRGFVSPAERRTNAKRFCDLPAAQLVVAPAWSYCVEGASDGLLKLAASPNLLRLWQLKFWTSATAEAAEAVLGSPQLRTVAALSLGTSPEWVRHLPTLAVNPSKENLSELHIEEGLSDESAAIIGGAPAFAKLRTFSAFRHNVTPEGIRAIFNSPHLSNLTALTLPGWYREEGAKAIAETRPKFRLRKLSMYGAWMTDAGAAMIANWPGFEAVRSFHIGGQCAVLGPRALAASPYARNLRELDLGLSRLDRQGALALARSKTLDLKRLLIRMTPAGEDEVAVAALVKRFGKDAVKVRYPGQRKRQ